MSYDRGIRREMESRFNIFPSKLLPLVSIYLKPCLKKESEIVKLCFIGKYGSFDSIF